MLEIRKVLKRFDHDADADATTFIHIDIFYLTFNVTKKLNVAQ